MTRHRGLIGISVLAGLALTGCGLGDDGKADQQFPANAQVGSVHLHLPQGWDQMSDEGSPGDELTAFSESLEGGATRYLYIREGFQGAGDIGQAIGIIQTEGLGQMDTQRQENADVPGADDAAVIDFTYELDGEEVTSRWWVMERDDYDAVVGVEYGGFGADQDEIDAYGDSIELRPDAESDY